MDIAAGDIVLCEFYFSNLKQSKKRPVLVFKDNLPFEDFIGLPLSSKTEKLQQDELVIDNSKLSEGVLPVSSKIMLRKPFVVSKNNPQKRYGRIGEAYLSEILRCYCDYFECGQQY